MKFSGKKMQFVKNLPVFIILLVSPPLVFGGSSLNVEDLGPPVSLLFPSEYYKLESLEPSAKEPGFLTAKVTSSHASYEVMGLVPLTKLLHEIEVIEQIKRDESGSGFVEGAVDSVKATGEGFVNLVSHPITSVKGVGKAAGKIGSAIGGMFTKSEEGEKSTFGEKVLGSSERELAQKFGVDVYTRNPYLKELLTQMARARLSGKGAAFVAKLLIPVAALVSVTLTASGINAAADQLVNDKSRGDLFRLNQEALIILGFSEDDTNKFLNGPHFTPRETTYMRFYLEKLKGIDGYREIFKRALDTNSAEEAMKILYEAQIAADSMNEKAKYTKIKYFSEGLALEEGSRVILATPYDYLDLSGSGKKVLKRLSDVKEDWKKSSAEIWNGGKISTDFMAAGMAQNVKMEPWLLFRKSDEEPESEG